MNTETKYCEDCNHFLQGRWLFEHKCKRTGRYVQIAIVRGQEEHATKEPISCIEERYDEDYSVHRIRCGPNATFFEERND